MPATPSIVDRPICAMIESIRMIGESAVSDSGYKENLTGFQAIGA
jgi:hypothetical protein